MLGLSLGERSALAAELIVVGDRPQAKALAEFVYPAGVSLDKPAELGRALREFLRGQRIGGGPAVIGIPLKWATIKSKELPPVEPALAAEMLRLGVERDFTIDPQELAVDFAGESSAAATRNVLMVAARRTNIAAAQEMAKAAGLSVEAITLSAMALSAEASLAAGRDAIVLHLSSGTAELGVQRQGVPIALRQFRAAEGAAATAIASEARRTIALLPHTDAAAGERLILLWDGIGLSGAAEALGQGLTGFTVRDESLASLGVESTLPRAQAARFAPAAALALVGLRGGRPAIDFIHSRLAPPAASRGYRAYVWGGAAAAAVLAAIVVGWIDLGQKQGEVAAKEKEIAAVADKVKAAKTSIAKIGFAEGWFRREPRFLAALRELTMVFSDDGQAWATNLVIKDEVIAPPPGAPASANLVPRNEVRGTLTGRAVDQKAALSVVERMTKASATFSDVKMLDYRAAGRDSREFSFTVSFNFVGVP